GVHKLLERFGFKKAAIQYTKHSEIEKSELTRLESPVYEEISVKMPTPTIIPLRDPKTQEWVFNELGKVKEKLGIPLFKKPIYEMVDGKLRLKKDDDGNYIFEY
nr:hypothetical protein [Crocosphaera sp.]